MSADSSDGDRDHAQRNSLRFHGNVGLQISDTISTRFYASVNNINQELPGALNLNTALTAPRTGNFIGDQARDIDSLRLQNRTSFTFGDAILNAGIFLNAKSLYHPIFQVVDQESLDKGGFFRLDWEKDTLALTLGGEARFGTVNSKRFINISGNRGAPTFQADQKARTMNLYAELRYKPVTSLSLIAGGIFANGKRQQQQNFNSFAGGVTDIYGSADFREFSPKFGLLFDVSPEIQFYSNINRSAEFPGFIELAQVASFVPLDAQSAWTYEIGSRGSAGPVSWDVSAYRSDIKGELLQFTVNADIPASTFNAGKTLHQGVEAGLTIKPAAWLRLRQTYNYSDFRFQGDAQFQDNRLPVVPRHVYRADLRIGNDRIHVAPNIEWVPQGAFADYNNALRISGYTLWGLTAGAKLSEKFELFLDARNLTNKKAIGDISAAINASLSSSIFQPIENRAVYGGVRTRF